MAVREPKTQAVCFLSCLIIALIPSTCAVSAERAVALSKRRGLIGEGKAWETRFYVNDSGVDGPTVLVTGGVHGNEPAGAAAAEQIRHWPIARGKLIVIPRVNQLGLDAQTRFIPGAEDRRKDLNRNFPYPDVDDQPRGEIATEVWEFVVEQQPDWLFDLHEGYEFHVSHKPKAGKDRSVGSSVIYDRDRLKVGPLVERMLAAANGLVTEPDRRLVPLTRGPKATTLARSAMIYLHANTMILETTFKDQRLPLRTRQHRVMMNAALSHLGMIEADCSDVLTAARGEPNRRLAVALYDDAGGSQRGVDNLASAFDQASELTVVQLGAAEIRSEVLDQFDVVVFGGGSGSKEAAAIGREGAEAVRSFVRGGGGYVGVCAGAFLCSAHYSWSLNLVDTHVFTGRREIEGVGTKQMWYRGKFSTQKMQLTEAGQRVFANIPENVDVRYQNGPIVSPKHFPGLQAYTPLAFFRSEQVLYPPQVGTMIDTPAIVMAPFGRGKVMSISPHPEATKGLELMVVTAVQTVAPRER